MTLDEIRKLAKQLEIPDFDVMELNKYKRLAKQYKEPANCIIWIPFEDEPANCIIWIPFEDVASSVISCLVSANPMVH